MKEEIWDFIFGIVKEKGKIDTESILNTYQPELDRYNITRDSLPKIIGKLIFDEKIFENANREYEVFPTAKNFIGYHAIKLRQENENQKSNKRDLRLRRIPIYLTIIFGITTIIFCYLTYSKNVKNTEEKIIVDSLKLEVLTYKSRIDSLENCLKEARSNKSISKTFKE